MNDVGEIVRVPFPFVERARMQARPALIVSLPAGPSGSLLWAVMITSARRDAWPGDIATGDDHAQFGLPVPCVIRTAKIATLSVEAIGRPIGRISAEMLAKVRAEMLTALRWL